MRLKDRVTTTSYFLFLHSTSFRDNFEKKGGQCISGLFWPEQSIKTAKMDLPFYPTVSDYRLVFEFEFGLVRALN